MCDIPFDTNIADKFYCSDLCKIKIRTGDVNLPALITAIIRRDDLTCQDCGMDDNVKKLVVHHMRSLSKGGSNSNENLITLCTKCHAHRHSSYYSPSLKNLQE
jgi:5-methylcytosine-specific restriction endonuclease McrA